MVNPNLLKTCFMMHLFSVWALHDRIVGLARFLTWWNKCVTHVTQELHIICETKERFIILFIIWKNVSNGRFKVWGNYSFFIQRNKLQFFNSRERVGYPWKQIPNPRQRIFSYEITSYFSLFYIKKTAKFF